MQENIYMLSTIIFLEPILFTLHSCTSLFRSCASWCSTVCRWWVPLALWDCVWDVRLVRRHLAREFRKARWRQERLVVRICFSRSHYDERCGSVRGTSNEL